MIRGGLFQHIKRVSDVLITTHRHADIDAYSSVYAISKILSLRGINSKIYFPDGINEDAKRIASLLSIPNKVEKFYESNLTIILDANDPALLCIDNNMLKKSIIIDHHPLLEDKIQGIKFIDTNASSTCEIICMLARKSRIALTKDIATALLLGIFADSKNLALANEQTVSSVAYLSRFTSIAYIKQILSRERSYSERIARLKSAKRLELYRIVDQDLIIAITEVGSYHASCAEALIDLGADLSIVISKDSSFKVSMRASNRFHSLTNLHLGIDIASKIGGGGHATAASFTTDDYKDVLEIIKMYYKIDKL